MVDFNFHSQGSEKSASRKMINNVPVVSPKMSFEEVHKYIVRNIDHFDTISQIYVVDSEKKLMGFFHVKDLLKLPKETIVGHIFKKAVVAVKPNFSQENAAHLAIAHNLKSLPVVDENNVFLGIIPSENILSIIYRETREDFLKFAGIHKKHMEIDDILQISLFDAFKHRIPWLVIGLLGGLLAASVTSYFDKTLEKNIVVVAFIPLIVYMADAVGTQIQSFAVRDLSISSKLDFSKYFSKQFLIVLSLALFIGTTLAIIIFFLYANIKLSIVLWLAITFTIISSMISGLII